MIELRKPIIDAFIKDRDNHIIQDIHDNDTRDLLDVKNIVIDNVTKHLESLYNPDSYLNEVLLEIAEKILDNELNTIAYEYIDLLD